jgi:hypothetical protein
MKPMKPLLDVGSGLSEGGEGESSPPESGQACAVRQVNERTPVDAEYESYSGFVGCCHMRNGAISSKLFTLEIYVQRALHKPCLSHSHLWHLESRER